MGTENIIKDTAWYLMKCNNPNKLVPQEKEDITEARWANDSEADFFLQNTFGAIRDVFEKYRQLVF
jgi:phage major head subunit gpT-like protein